jgi:hypothetical protein
MEKGVYHKISRPRLLKKMHANRSNSQNKLYPPSDKMKLPRMVKNLHHHQKGRNEKFKLKPTQANSM